MVLCSTGSRFFFFFELIQSSLAGARGGQVVAVLVLGPKPQPLLVLLLWFFGSVLSRATWEEGETGDGTLALSRSSAAREHLFRLLGQADF